MDTRETSSGFRAPAYPYETSDVTQRVDAGINAENLVANLNTACRVLFERSNDSELGTQFSESMVRANISEIALMLGVVPERVTQAQIEAYKNFLKGIVTVFASELGAEGAAEDKLGRIKTANSQIGERVLEQFGTINQAFFPGVTEGMGAVVGQTTLTDLAVVAHILMTHTRTWAPNIQNEQILARNITKIYGKVNPDDYYHNQIKEGQVRLPLSTSPVSEPNPNDVKYKQLGLALLMAQNAWLIGKYMRHLGDCMVKGKWIDLQIDHNDASNVLGTYSQAALKERGFVENNHPQSTNEDKLAYLVLFVAKDLFQLRPDLKK